MLPRRDGLLVCRELRARGCHAPASAHRSRRRRPVHRGVAPQARAAVRASAHPAARDPADHARRRKRGNAELRESAGTVLKSERAAAQLLSSDGTVETTWGDLVARHPMRTPDQRRTALAGPTAITRRRGQPGAAFRVVAVPVTRHGRAGVVVAAAALAPVQRAVRRVALLLGLGGAAALAVAAGDEVDAFARLVDDLLLLAVADAQRVSLRANPSTEPLPRQPRRPAAPSHAPRPRRRGDLRGSRDQSGVGLGSRGAGARDRVRVSCQESNPARTRGVDGAGH